MHTTIDPTIFLMMTVMGMIFIYAVVGLLSNYYKKPKIYQIYDRYAIIQKNYLNQPIKFFFRRKWHNYVDYAEYDETTIKALGLYSLQDIQTIFEMMNQNKIIEI